ncbi:MAG TPA: alpha/beta fold hydrolase [Rhizomicrobium sp.]|jgi:non-heme chloroperoxidase|nr:alpha/beta fold hydrolase [Rhizomicrobium sp.]
MLTVLACLVLAIVLAFAAVIAFSAPKSLPPMASVSNAFEGVDFQDLPPKQLFAARDGEKLALRAYPGDPLRIAMLIHGSAGTSASMHPLARALQAHGATVYALGMRGHDGTGRSGDIAYIGQLEDDVVDFVRTLGPRPPGQHRTLLGFSSGGGFALRFAGGPNGALFDRLILVSPQFPYHAPTSRPDAGGWVSLALPRIVALTALNRIGIAAFNALPVLALAVDRKRLAQTQLTPVYSFSMLRSFAPGDDYLGDVRRVNGPLDVFVGASDEIFRAEHYAPLLKPVRPEARVTVVPGLGHMDMTIKPAALDAIAAALG